jgi:hypothetical protein
LVELVNRLPSIVTNLFKTFSSFSSIRFRFLQVLTADVCFALITFAYASQFMSKVGNDMFNARCEGKLARKAKGKKPEPSATMDAKARYIRKKYAELRYADPSIESLAGKHWNKLHARVL